MPSSTFQLEKQDLMNVASGGWIDSKGCMEYNSDMFQHGIMTKWFDPTFIPLLKAKGYSAVKRYCKGKDLLKNEVLLFPVHKPQHWSLLVVHIQRHVIICIDSLHQSNIDAVNWIWQNAHIVQRKIKVRLFNLCCHVTTIHLSLVESNAESLGCDIDAADDEDDSYAEAENDTDCNSDTDGDHNAGVSQDFLVPDFRNAPDPDDIFALRWESLLHEELPTLQKKNLGPTLQAILSKDIPYQIFKSTLMN
eukprot:Em0768g1a